MLLPFRYLLLGLCLLLSLSLVLSLTLGNIHLSWNDWLDWLGPAQSQGAQIIEQLRWPRTFSALLAGGLLALAGLLMQVLLRNPLADPFVLGLSGGASVAALLAMLVGLSGWLLSGAAFIGALASLLLVMVLAASQGRLEPNRLLLTGVVLSSLWSALIALILSLSPDKDLRGLLFWLLGDLVPQPFRLWLALPLPLCTLLAFMAGRHLNLLAEGEDNARALGVDTRKLSWMLYLGASALTALAVSLCGTIGFVGLLTPHALRLVGVSNHRHLALSTPLLGASLVLLADTLARLVAAPIQLPLGVVTALLGVPLLLWLLSRRSGC